MQRIYGKLRIRFLQTSFLFDTIGLFVLFYLKNPLGPLSEEETDSLENYLLAAGVRGGRRLRDGPRGQRIIAKPEIILVSAAEVVLRGLAEMVSVVRRGGCVFRGRLFRGIFRLDGSSFRGRLFW